MGAPRIFSISGLSPRVRGNLAEEPATDYYNGSIPACAGEPASSSASARVGRVYPRVCGGTFRRQRIRIRIPGLSPRVRGNPPDNPSAAAAAWASIPACAGEPPRGGQNAPASDVYPRVCGGTSLGGHFGIQG